MLELLSARHHTLGQKRKRAQLIAGQQGLVIQRTKMNDVCMQRNCQVQIRKSRYRHAVPDRLLDFQRQIRSSLVTTPLLGREPADWIWRTNTRGREHVSIQSIHQRVMNVILLHITMECSPKLSTQIVPDHNEDLQKPITKETAVRYVHVPSAMLTDDALQNLVPRIIGVPEPRNVIVTRN